MLKKTLIVAAAAGVVGLASLPLQVSTAAADTVMTCRDAAKLKYPTDRKMRHEFRRACKEAWRAQKNAGSA
jgi:hypothetical protein